MDNTETLSEGLRVNVTVADREALEAMAKWEQRSVAFVIRRAIRRELALARKQENPSA